MTDTVAQISDLMHEVGETHHRVFRIVDGADADWASWYAQWLIDLSELPGLLGVKPVRSDLICVLVGLDRQYAAENPGEPWEGPLAAQPLPGLGRLLPAGLRQPGLPRPLLLLAVLDEVDRRHAGDPARYRLAETRAARGESACGASLA
jgi:hypothetical protein